MNSLRWITLLIIQIIRQGESLECYRCTYKRISQRRNRTDPIFPCSEFDGHSRYLVQCPQSTMCMMKTIRLDLADGDWVQITTRGCADQSVSYRRYSSSRGWYRATEVFPDTYSEGCQISEHLDRIKVTRTEHCYCSQDGCNGELKLSPIPPPIYDSSAAVRWTGQLTLTLLLSTVLYTALNIYHL